MTSQVSHDAPTPVPRLREGFVAHTTVLFTSRDGISLTTYSEDFAVVRSQLFVPLDHVQCALLLNETTLAITYVASPETSPCIVDVVTLPPLAQPQQLDHPTVQQTAVPVTTTRHFFPDNVVSLRLVSSTLFVVTARELIAHALADGALAETARAPVESPESVDVVGAMPDCFFSNLHDQKVFFETFTKSAYGYELALPETPPSFVTFVDDRVLVGVGASALLFNFRNANPARKLALKEPFARCLFAVAYNGALLLGLQSDTACKALVFADSPTGRNAPHPVSSFALPEPPCVVVPVPGQRLFAVLAPAGTVFLDAAFAFLRQRPKKPFTMHAKQSPLL